MTPQNPLVEAYEIVAPYIGYYFQRGGELLFPIVGQHAGATILVGVPIMMTIMIPFLRGLILGPAGMLLGICFLYVAGSVWVNTGSMLYMLIWGATGAYLFWRSIELMRTMR